MGSNAYLAPEVLLNSPHGKSLDWYGVGVVLYELLVGYPPYLSTDQATLF